MDPATLLVTALALAAFGTGGDMTTTTTTVDPLIDDPVTLTVSAGEVGGVDERIAIAPNGEAWVENGNAARLSFGVGPREYDAVAGAAEIAFAQGSARLPLRCLDCPIYDVRLGPERLGFDHAARDRSVVLNRLVEKIEATVPEELTR
ncbi:hypothetical protein HJD18_03065 [Thermoleophilia bacterium SCSIO 60948]|nr:hypothetical protein HJD18_03065 [Thermoleophilia bacterium SCSIO 60948]